MGKEWIVALSFSLISASAFAGITDFTGRFVGNVQMTCENGFVSDGPMSADDTNADLKILQSPPNGSGDFSLKGNLDFTVRKVNDFVDGKVEFDVVGHPNQTLDCQNGSSNIDPCGTIDGAILSVVPGASFPGFTGFMSKTQFVSSNGPFYFTQSSEEAFGQDSQPQQIVQMTVNFPVSVYNTACRVRGTLTKTFP
jgi:hypothetical protein